MPPQVDSIGEIKESNTKEWTDAPLQYYHFMTDRKKSKGDFYSARNEFLKNDHCIISTANPTEDSDLFYRNSYKHELIFVHHGEGDFLSEYGRLSFEQWDYIIVPKGTTYQMKFKSYNEAKIFIVESDTPFEIPKHFRNEYGQLKEDAPYYERDFKVPQFMEPD